MRTGRRIDLETCSRLSLPPGGDRSRAMLCSHPSPSSVGPVLTACLPNLGHSKPPATPSASLRSRGLASDSFLGASWLAAGLQVLPHERVVLLGRRASLVGQAPWAERRVPRPHVGCACKGTLAYLGAVLEAVVRSRDGWVWVKPPRRSFRLGACWVPPHPRKHAAASVRRVPRVRAWGRAAACVFLVADEKTRSLWKPSHHRLLAWPVPPCPVGPSCPGRSLGPARAALPGCDARPLLSWLLRRPGFGGICGRCPVSRCPSLGSVLLFSLDLVQLGRRLKGP